jgi:DNA-binding beta-propeller fold protein YncE
MGLTLLRLSSKSCATKIIASAFLLFLTAMDSFANDFTTKQREAVEQDNNVFASKGYIVENVLYRNKTVGSPALMAYDTNGRFYIMNNKGEIFLYEIAKNNSLVFTGLSCPITAVDIVVNTDGSVIGLEKNEVFKLTKEGKKTLLTKIPDGINPSRLSVNNKNEIYIIDDVMHVVYFLNKRGVCVQKKFDFLILDISFDEQNNMYILDDQKKIHVLSSNGRDFKSAFEIPKNRNPDRIAVNRKGSQFYLLDTEGMRLSAMTRYGIFRNVAIFSTYHAPHSRPIIGNDDTIYLLTGEYPKKARIIRIGTDEDPHRSYAVAYELADYSPDAMGIDKNGKLYFGNGKKIVAIKNNSFDQEVVFDDKNLLRDPEGISFDSQGNCYVPDDAAVKVFKIDKSNKMVSIFADKAIGLKEPQALVFDKAGNAFIADMQAKAIFKITPEGAVSRFVTEKDGIKSIEDIAIDSNDFIYMAPKWNDRVLKISPKAEVSVFADINSGLIGPSAITIDSKGFVYVVDEETSTVYKFNPEGKIEGRVKINLSTLRHLRNVAGSPKGKVYVGSHGIVDTVIYSVNFNRRINKKSQLSQGFYALQRLCGLEDGLFMPSGIAFDKDTKTLYIGTPEMLFKFQNNKIIPVCKIDYCGFRDLALDKNGDIIVTGGGIGKIYRIGKNLAIQTLATKSDGLISPEGITLDDHGRIYIADENAEKIFVIEDKKVKTIKGIKFLPEKIFYHDSYFYVTEDGPARFSKITIDPTTDFNATMISECRIPYCEGTAIDKDENIYLSSDGRSEIYKFKQLTDEKNIIADWQDGLVGPESLVIDDEGNLYVADQEAHAVFKINKIKGEP